MATAAKIKQDGLQYEFKVTVPQTDVAKMVETSLTGIQKRVKMDGFRPGKVPMNLVKQRYATQALGEAVEELVNTSTQKTLKDNNLRAAVQPKIEVQTYPEGKDLEYKLTVEVLPTFTPVDVTTLSFERTTATPTDKEIDQRLQDLAKRMPQTASAADGYAAKMGDTAVINFTGKLNGVERKEMAGERFPLELGSNSFIPGFEEKLVGVKKDDQRTITLNFPADYHSEEFAGQPAEFTVTVTDIRTPKDATVDEEFAKMLGMKDLATLREAISKSLENEFQSISRGKLKRAVMDKLSDAHDFALPATMVEQEFQGIWRQLQADKAQGKLDEDDKGKTDAQLEKEYRTIAERRVRLGLVLAEIGTAQKVKVDQRDLQAALRAEASRYPGQEQQIVEFYTQNGGALQALQAQIFEDKVIDKIIEISKVTDKAVTPEALRKMAD
ncbi:MAG: trigger factor [Bdellovibrionales bacterium]